MKNTLPLLSEMILPSFRTIMKGIKIKKEGIAINKTFENVYIDNSSLKSYREFLNWNADLPLAFFYLMNSIAFSKASVIPSTFLPPAVAKNGCPPPPP